MEKGGLRVISRKEVICKIESNKVRIKGNLEEEWK
jgi:hypothetical protein